TVLALASFQGSLVAAGRFTQVNGTSAAGLAMWTGGTWLPLGTGVHSARGTPGEGHALAGVTSAARSVGGGVEGGRGWAMGGGRPAASLGRWHGTGWSALAGGADGAVDALAWYNGTLVAGGRFETAGGVAAPWLARHVTGGAVETWEPLGAGVDGPVDALLAL